MKKTTGKIIEVKINKKNWGKTRAILLLLGLFIIANIEVSAQVLPPCDPTASQTVTRVSTPFIDPQTNASVGYARYDIWRSERIDHYVHLFIQAPADTVFKVYQNGTEIGTVTPVINQQTQQISYWSWDVWWNAPQPPHPPVGKVGDVITITKNGQPYLSGTYTREPHDYEAADGFIIHGNPYPCSLLRGTAYLPGSANPRTFRLYILFAYAPNPITKITLNEPSQQSGIPGPEIRQYTFTTTNTPTDGWYRALVNETFTVLTEAQFAMLRQNLLSITVYTAQHPNGYSQISIQTQGINSNGDFEGDGITDLAVFRPTEQKWYLQFSSTNQVQTTIFGLPTDKVVIGDYDADNRFDITTFQTNNPDFPGKGVWQILRSSDNSVRTIEWGLSGDIPLSLDIDQNNTSDLGVYRPSNGTWYIHRMGDIIKPLTGELGGQVDLTVRWGTEGDKPLVGDFNNDNVDELVIFRPSEGNWYIYDYAHDSYQILHWGLSGDIPMAKDFDGDSKADLAVYRPSEGMWYIRGSLDGSFIVRRFGLSEDIPVPADFDKDSVADIAVFRPSNGTWYVIKSSDNSFFAQQFGINGDIPAIASR